MASRIRLPGSAWLDGVLARALERQLAPPGVLPGTFEARFLEPAGEPACTPAGGISWRVFAFPVAVFVGGVAAVVLELAEPRVRTGVWEHTRFRTHPIERMRATAYATMMSVYGPATAARALIAQVDRRHAAVRGVTPAGEPYQARDPELLAWVQVTALHGFLQAYRSLVAPVDTAQADAYYAEGAAAAALYGVPRPPRRESEANACLAAMAPRLEASDTVFEFLALAGRMAALPAPLRPLQRLLVRAAVDGVPHDIRVRLALDGPAWHLECRQHAVARVATRLLGGRPLPTHPAVLACRRLGIDPDSLYIRPASPDPQ